MATIQESGFSQSGRVLAARARLAQLRKQQGVPEFDIDRLLATTCKSDETDEELLAFLHEIRSEDTAK